MNLNIMSSNEKTIPMKKNLFKPFVYISIIAVSVIACSDDDDDSSSTTTPTGGNSLTVPDVYNKIYGATSVSNDGTNITIQTNGMPDHVSPYYDTSNTLYEDYSGTTFSGVNFRKNPNTIVSQTLTFTIPLTPSQATSTTATSLGPIGVALNGVALYNQYAGPNNQALTNEITSFDKYYGHPQGQGQYHYHVEPLYLTTVTETDSSLMGFLLDGFPVYGPKENGATVISADLDAFHGHTHATADYPNGIYHYHFTADDPYLNGSGFYGAPGTVTQ